MRVRKYAVVCCVCARAACVRAVRARTFAHVNDARAHGTHASANDTARVRPPARPRRRARTDAQRRLEAAGEIYAQVRVRACVRACLCVSLCGCARARLPTCAYALPVLSTPPPPSASRAPPPNRVRAPCIVNFRCASLARGPMSMLTRDTSEGGMRALGGALPGSAHRNSRRLVRGGGALGNAGFALSAVMPADRPAAWAHRPSARPSLGAVPSFWDVLGT